MTKEEEAVIEAVIRTLENRDSWPARGMFAWAEVINTGEALRASRQPKKCEPPEGTDFATEHWLRSHQGDAATRWWFSGGWVAIGSQNYYDSKEMAELGWTYLAPCLPPVEWSEDEIFSLWNRCGGKVTSFARALLSGKKP